MYDEVAVEQGVLNNLPIARFTSPRTVCVHDGLGLLCINPFGEQRKTGLLYSENKYLENILVIAAFCQHFILHKCRTHHVATQTMDGVR